MDAFFEALGTYAAVPDQRMAERWEWPGRAGPGLHVRDALYTSLLEELGAAARVRPEPEAAGTVALAQRAFGELRGLLAGLEDQMLDQSPGAPEWTLRLVLGHVLLTERSYQAQTRYAAARSDADPIRIDLDLSLSEAETGGGLSEWVARLAEARGAAAELATLEDARLARPTNWAGYDVDVRFRLHRFAVHMGEHTIQSEKLLAALGRAPTEAQRIARLISAERGAHELSTPPEELALLDAVHLERAQAL